MLKILDPFLKGASFYRRSCINFSKIAQPLCRHLSKDVPLFVFDDKCKEAFRCLKEKIVTTSILQPPNWELPFELMCDTSDKAIGVVLGRKVVRYSNVIYYAFRALDDAQCNYTTTKKSFILLYLD